MQYIDGQGDILYRRLGLYYFPIPTYIYNHQLCEGDCLIFSIFTNISSYWSLPLHALFKLNFDRSAIGNLGVCVHVRACTCVMFEEVICNCATICLYPIQALLAPVLSMRWKCWQ